jgi:phosphoglycolate phosphatase
VKPEAPAALVFDLDGTLSDPAVGIRRSIDFALARFGFPPIPETHVSRHIGPPLDATFRALTGEASPARIAELVAAFRERYGAIGYAENVLYPGIREAIERFAGRGVTLALCTSKRADFAERILTLFGLRAHFALVSGGDIGVEKAQQLGALLATRGIGARSVMIGDRAIDIHAARANALRAVGVLWGHGPRDELESAAPERILCAPHELDALADLL